ncbi:hypothetical protein F0562_004516 [Nyssa sinensis]|uniref:Uncharacterized protein n=1 Tax=Nyssa sinensis TaxID=561372 RepID=A0A5J5BYF5_9ASTE|nr:hypothetical protein F0562_004516 [Nyssa sinensis]
MGGCVSVNKHADSSMKLRLSFGSKTEKLVIPSPIKDKTVVNGDRPITQVGLKSQWSPSHPVTTFRDFGSKEETFFDSQPWLESDCEDDFFSVNGDFTPSRGSTPVHHSFSIGTLQVNKSDFIPCHDFTPSRGSIPVHHSFSMGTLQVNKALLEDKTPSSKPEPSPTENKKSLSELFQESFREDPDVDNENMENKMAATDIPQKSANGTPYISETNSICSSQRTPNADFRAEKEKSARSAQCCLPSFLSSRSSSERKKMSPARSLG